MHRRIYQRLAKNQGDNRGCLKEEVQFLRKQFFREFSTPIDFDRVLQNICVCEYREKQVLFEQGDLINRYYFLLAGRVFLERRGGRSSEKSQTAILDRQGVIGQFFYDSSLKRSHRAETISSQNPVLLFYIDKNKFDQLFQAQVSQYNLLKQRLSQFSSISTQYLQRFQKHNIRSSISSHTLQDKVCFIITGECTLNNSQGTITLMAGDCLNLQGYFNQRDKIKSNISQYKVISSQLLAFTLSFQYIDNLPEHFKQKIRFLHDCHSTVQHSMNTSFHTNLAQSISVHEQQRLRCNRKLPLPKMKRQKTQDDYSRDMIRQYGQRISQKNTKSQSILQIRHETRENLQIMRKFYCLGYRGKQKLSQPSTSKHTGSPRGYFQLPISKDTKKNVVIQKRRDWAAYMGQRFKEKEKLLIKKIKKKNESKQNYNGSKNSEIFDRIFKKCQSLQSLYRLKKTSKLTKVDIKDRTKLFMFPSKI